MKRLAFYMIAIFLIHSPLALAADPVLQNGGKEFVGLASTSKS